MKLWHVEMMLRFTDGAVLIRQDGPTFQHKSEAESHIQDVGKGLEQAVDTMMLIGIQEAGLRIKEEAVNGSLIELPRLRPVQ